MGREALEHIVLEQVEELVSVALPNNLHYPFPCLGFHFAFSTSSVLYGRATPSHFLTLQLCIHFLPYPRTLVSLGILPDGQLFSALANCPS